MDESLDLRVQKTYTALIQAFFDIVQEKPVDKFTVNELCKKAQVRRPTFYKHFNDKYDFIKFVIHTIQKETLQDIDSTADTKQPLDYLLTCFKKVIELLEKYQQVLLHFKIDSLDEFPFEIIDDYLEMQLEKKLTYFLEQNPQLPQDPDFTCQILLGMYRQIALWWIKNKETTTKEEVTAKMKQFLLLLFPAKNNVDPF